MFISHIVFIGIVLGGMEFGGMVFALPGIMFCVTETQPPDMPVPCVVVISLVPDISYRPPMGPAPMACP